MTTTEINFDVTKHENIVIRAIAKRAIRLAATHDIDYSMMSAMMDIAAVHANDCRLRLEELRDADDFNFIHDVFGIRKNINRETGKLENCFLPRYSA